MTNRTTASLPYVHRAINESSANPFAQAAFSQPAYLQSPAVRQLSVALSDPHANDSISNISNRANLNNGALRADGLVDSREITLHV